MTPEEKKQLHLFHKYHFQRRGQGRYVLNKLRQLNGFQDYFWRQTLKRAAVEASHQAPKFCQALSILDLKSNARRHEYVKGQTSLAGSYTRYELHLWILSFVPGSQS